MAENATTAPGRGAQLWQAIKNYPKTYWLMLKGFYNQVKEDFNKEGRADFFKAKRHVNLLIGMAFTTLASYVTYYAYDGQINTLTGKLAINIPLMVLASWMFAAVIDLAQGKGSNGDPRFTRYGAVPGTLVVGMCWYFNYNGWLLPVAGLAVAALAYYLWKPKK